VQPRPKFKPDELVVPCEPFTGDNPDGSVFVLNPSNILRGDDDYVLRYPHMFRRQGDEAALREYHDAVYAEQVAYRTGQRELEARAAAERRKRIEALADKLEDQERTRLQQAAKTLTADGEARARSRRQREKEAEKAARDAGEHAAAIALVHQRLAAEGNE